MYAKYWKRFFDFTLSLLALIVLSPVLLILTIVGAIAMRGNPFFVQPRPGRIDPKTGKERIFKLIKFRTMSNGKDKDGNLLPDEQRLNKYGRFLRKTSLDEIGELLNILVGDMAIVGPRPWSIEYLPYYTDEEHNRHSVRPGLTGYAQVHGRTKASWNDRILCDLEYVSNVTLKNDIKIIIETIGYTLKHSDVVITGEEQGDFSNYRIAQWEEQKKDGYVRK